jgi:membrane associated rhomboid family serine protease
MNDEPEKTPPPQAPYSPAREPADPPGPDTARPAHPHRPPAINAPAVIIFLAVVLITVELLRMLAAPSTERWMVFAFGFVPVRFAEMSEWGALLPLHPWGSVTSFFTYALLHAGFGHLAINTVAMLAFGSPVARRFGAVRFLLFSLVAAVAGAVLHLMTNLGSIIPMVGASAMVSGQMAAAIRFALSPGGPLTAAGRRNPQAAIYAPVLPLGQAFRDSRIVAFVGIWMVANILFGVTPASIAGAEVSIAWQAHIGGFLAGLLLFRFFDPVRKAPSGPNGSAFEE